MFFDAWSQVGRVVAVGAATYAALVLGLRVAGKRTLAKLNAFDLVVTVALGSMLASSLLSSDVAWAEAATGFAVLIGAQYLIAALSSRVRFLRNIVKSHPVALVRHGCLHDDVCRRERVATGEVLQVIRASGAGDIADVAAVVLETDGSMSVISASAFERTALADVEGFDTDGSTSTDAIGDIVG